MCGRMTLSRRDAADVAAELEAELEAPDARAFRPRYNVAPANLHWIVRDEGGRRRLRPAAWGLSGRPAGLVINARAETLGERRMFREALARRRCVVPADGFFEWQDEKGKRRPIWFHAPDGALLQMAGLWEPGEDGRPSFTVITTAANEVVAAVHDRMPALLPGARVREWLERPALDLLCPAATTALVGRPVSLRANDAANDDAGVLEPPEPEAPARQLRLL